MNTKQENKLSMYETVLELFSNNPAIVALILAFSNAATTFTNKVALLQAQVALQTAIITGVAAAKKTRKTALIDQMLFIIGALRAYAKATGDDELFNFVNYKRYKLEAQADTVLTQLANSIKDKANLHLAALADYGITAVVMAAYQTAITNYALFVPKPRTARVSKKTVTKNIKDLIKQIDELLLDELDALAIQFKVANADFYNNYLSSRIIIDLGSTTAKVRGTVKNAEDVPLVGATFFITLTGQTQKVGETLAVTGGKYGIANLLPNDYDLYWERVGYIQKVETNLHIPAGKEFTRHVVLQHISPFTGTVNSGQILNVLGPLNPEWAVGVTFKIRNTTTGPAIGGLTFYPATNPGDAPNGQGSTLLPGQEETHTLTAADFKAFLNIQNQGPNPQTYEITIL